MGQVFIPLPLAIILLLATYVFFNSMAYGQNSPIAKGLSPVTGNLYHLGGNLGIGTNNPQKKLHIHSIGNTTLRLSETCAKCNYAFGFWDFFPLYAIFSSNNRRRRFSVA